MLLFNGHLGTAGEILRLLKGITLRLSVASVVTKTMYERRHMITVAISGSSGFLGSHLVKALTERKYRILRISQELLYNPAELKEFFKAEQPDYIFHLAAYGNMSNQEDVAMTVFANLLGTYNVLDASKEVDYKKFVNFSTSSVLLPQETFYSASKAGAERLANAFSQTGKPVLTVRPFSIYGDGEADFRFIPTVIKHLLNGEKMKVVEDASHDWVYVKDFTDTLIVKLNDNGIVNMGTGISHSNKEVIGILENISGKKLHYTKVKALRSFDTKTWVCPTKTITSDIEEGLKKTYEYYQQRFKA